MSMTAQYPPHPLAKALPRKQTPRKPIWRTKSEPFDPARVSRLSGRDNSSMISTGGTILG